MPYYTGDYLFVGAGAEAGAGMGIGMGTGIGSVTGSQAAAVASGAGHCDRIICVLKYTGVVRSAISAYKFYGRRDYSRTFAALLCERIERVAGTGVGASGAGADGAGVGAGVSGVSTGGAGVAGLGAGGAGAGSAGVGSYDFVTCVPLSRRRLHERGYNQAAILAKYSAAHLGLAFTDALLIRNEHALRQGALNRQERRVNAETAFGVDLENSQGGFMTGKFIPYKLIPGRRLIPGRIMPGRHRPGEIVLDGARVLLIDDIATSMSTINACAATLKAHGAAEVTGAVLAASVQAGEW
ncbi:MAG: hypothetical protein FWH01_02510 [Oscillospiraceae bacterium]|nr:hypothetical protein [Oscillospiraceae bacterium]